MAQSTLEDFLSQYATVRNALEYDKMEDKIYHLSNKTGLNRDNPLLDVLENKLLDILEEIDTNPNFVL
jgi:hypothetical protein